MGTIELRKGKSARLPIVLFTVILPLLFVLSLGIVFASAPTAVDDAYNAVEDTPLIIPAPGVLSNDIDVHSGEAILETAPQTGTVDLAASGAFTYTPLLDFSGIVTFSYYISKTGEISDVGNVTITVTAVNDAPTANDDNATTPEDTAVAIPVLANDSDVDGNLDPATVIIVSEPLSGTTGVNLLSGAVTYTPTLNFNGNDSFVYQVFDDGSPTPTLPVTATVYVTVTAVNDAPTALNDSSATAEDAILTVDPPGVLTNDSDVDNGDTLSVVGFDTLSSKGAAVSMASDGSYSYDPTAVADFNALAVSESTNDTFSYTVSDSGGLTDTATVSITVNGVNDLPTAGDDFYSTDEDSVLAVPAPGVLVGDTDPDSSDVITAVSTITTSSMGAAVTINSDGTLTYDPQNVTAFQQLNEGESDQDTFNYDISDGHGGTDTGTVTVTIDGLNDAPAIDNSGDMTLADIDEDNINNSGTLISLILASAGGTRITDADAGSVEGIAVVGTTNIHGTWQYSLNGSNWTSFNAASDFNAVLLDTTEFIRFVPNPDYYGPAGTISFRAWDQTAGFSGQANVNVFNNGWTTPYSSDVETATLTVLNVNDAPVLDNSGDMTLTSIGEDHTTNPGDTVAAIIASAGGNRITDADASDEEGIAVVGIDNAHGIWQYSINGGLNWLNLNVSLTSATLLGPQSRIRFLPQANYFGPAGSITFRAWDLTSGNVGDTGVSVSSNGGTTAFSTATETASLTVYSINDAPFVDLNGGGGGSTNFGASFTEDGGPVVIVDSDLSITDVDDANMTSARAVLTNIMNGADESLMVNTGSLGITAVYSTTTGILNLTGSATKADYELVLRTLAYNNTSQDPNTDGRLVEVTVNDGTDNSNVALSVVSITPVNDVPILVTNATLPVNEGISATITISRLLVTDVDNAPSEIVYRVISPPAHGDLLLSGSPLATNDTFTQADINSNVLDYDNDGSEFNADSFTFTVADGSGGSIGVTTFNISVNGNNDLPVLATNAGLTVNEHATSTITNSRLKVTDADNTAVELTYRLEIPPAHGNLLLNSTPLVTNDIFTQADINSAKLAYAHDGSETTSDSFTFAVEDGSGGTIDSTVFNITIIPVNDPPSVDLNGAPSGYDYSATFTEDGGAVAIVDGTLTVSDVDNTSLVLATAVLANRPNGTAESLSVDTKGTNISASYNPGTGVLTLVGVDTLSNYQTVLRSLEYNNVSQDPSAVNRIVTITANDGSASSNAATSTITVQPVNDPPALSKNAGLTLDYGATSVINGTLLKITDLDNSTSELVYTVKVLPTNGQIKLNGTPLTLNGTFTQANVDNGQLTYTHNKTNTESDSFQFTAVDGDGGSISQKTFAIVIHPQPIVYLPVALNNYIYSEPNNSACQAFSIALNGSYQFLPDDEEDWYKFILAAPGNVAVQISGYTPPDGQMLVYTGNVCSAISQIGHDPSISPNGHINLNGLPAGTYYVRVYTNNPPAAPSPYTLTVTTP